jgi:hypothetical protein
MHPSWNPVGSHDPTIKAGDFVRGNRGREMQAAAEELFGRGVAGIRGKEFVGPPAPQEPEFDEKLQEFANKVKQDLAGAAGEYVEHVKKINEALTAGKLGFAEASNAMTKLTIATLGFEKLPHVEFEKQIDALKKMREEVIGTGLEGKQIFREGAGKAFLDLEKSLGTQPAAGVSPILAGSAADLSMTARMQNDPHLDLQQRILDVLQRSEERDNQKITEMQQIGNALKDIGIIN